MGPQVNTQGIDPLKLSTWPNSAINTMVTVNKPAG